MSELFLEQVFFYIAGFLAGYFAACAHRKQQIDGPSLVSKVKNSFEAAKNRIEESRIPTGQIKPKTAQDIYQKNRPQIEKEGLQAVKETLDAIPELVEHKKLLEQAKKIGAS